MTTREMFDLVECVRRAESPFAEVNADAIGFPVKVCEGVYLWRLTAGASAWLDAYESFFACSSIQSSCRSKSLL